MFVRKGYGRLILLIAGYLIAIIIFMTGLNIIVFTDGATPTIDNPGSSLSWKNVGEFGFTNNPDGVRDLHTFIDSNDTIYVSASQTGAGNNDTTVYKYESGDWVQVGDSTVSTFGKIMGDDSGNLYVLGNEGGDLTLYTLIGTTWTLLGDYTGIETSTFNYMFDAAVDNNGDVVISYIDSDRNANVVKYDVGLGNWSFVGSNDYVVSHFIGQTIIKTDNNGDLYVLVPYTPNPRMNLHTVMYYDGLSWQNLGFSGAISPSSGESSNIDFDLYNSTPYLLYQDSTASNNPSLITYDGSDWSYVNSAGIINYGLNFRSDLDLHVSPVDGQVFMTFAGQDDGATMYSISTNSAVTQIGQSEFTPGSAVDIITFTDSNNEPKFAYVDSQYGSNASVMEYNRKLVAQIDENTDEVITIEGSDADIFDTLQYSLIGSVDDGLFEIDSASGEITFTQAPDFENPLDFDRDNVYIIEAQVEDGGARVLSDSILVEVIVNDIDPEVNAPQIVNPIEYTWEQYGQSNFANTTGIHTPFDVTKDSNDTIYVVTNNASTVEIYTYANDTWQLVGSPIPLANSFLPRIALDSNDKPYVFVSSNFGSGAIRLYEFQGGSWNELSSTFPVPGYRRVEMVIGRNGFPAVLVNENDSGNSLYGHLEVFEFNTNTLTWSSVAGRVDGDGPVNSTTSYLQSPQEPNVLLYDEVNDEYVIIYRNGNGSKLKSVRSTGSSWEEFGGLNIDPSGGRFQEGFIDQEGGMYLSYTDNFYQSRGVTVKKYHAPSDQWELVGNPSFNEDPLAGNGQTTQSSLVLNNEFKPFASYKDHSLQLSLQLYDNSNWNFYPNTISENINGLSDVEYQKIVMDNRGFPVILYKTSTDQLNALYLKKTISIQVDENQTSVADINASDDDAGDNLIFSISGDDAGDLTIDSLSGEIIFNQSPDFENPQDNDINNVYEIDIQVSDNSPSNLSDFSTLEVEVLDLDTVAVEFEESEAQIDENSIIPFSHHIRVFGEILTTDTSVDIVLSDNQTSAADYNSVATTITIPSGDYTSPQLISVDLLSVIDDQIDELDESLSITLVNPGPNVAIGDVDGDFTVEDELTLTIVDDDTAAVDADPQSGIVIDEDQSNSQFLVSLETEPLSDVLILISSDDSGAAVPVIDSLTFTSGNWNIPQAVGLQAVQDDDLVDENVVFTFSVDGVNSSDEYDGVDDITRIVQVSDSDLPSITTAITSAGELIEGTADTLQGQVVLDYMPQNVVVVEVLWVERETIAISPTQFIFDASNWNIPQSFTIEALEDDNSESETISITFSVVDESSSDDFDDAPNSIEIAQVTDNDDNDGVDTEIEDLAPLNGDGNNDGLLDSLQADVVSLPNTLSNNEYITLDGNGCEFTSVVLISEVELGEDSQYEYPNGLVDFEVDCASLNIDIYFYNIDEGVARKFNNSGFTDLTPSPVVEVGLQGDGNSYYKLSYSVNDGDQNDISPSGDGVVRDPVGIGTIVSESSEGVLIRTGGI